MKEQSEIIALFREDGEIPDKLYEAILEHLITTYGDGVYSDIEICAIKKILPQKIPPDIDDVEAGIEDDNEPDYDEEDEEIIGAAPDTDNMQKVGLTDIQIPIAYDIIGDGKRD